MARVSTPLLSLALSLLLARPAAHADVAGCVAREGVGGGLSCDEVGPGREGEGELRLLQQDLLTRRGADRLSELQLGTFQVAKQAMETTTTTLPPTGLTMNAEGDLEAFVSATCANSGAVVFMVIAFSFLRLRYPIMYSHNVLEGISPSKPENTLFGWFKPTVSVTIDEVVSHITLDHAMMLEFTHLSMKIFAVVGLPMCFIMAPLNAACGGRAAGQDHLSFFSLGNISEGNRIYWASAMIVWIVVIAVTLMIHRSHKTFLRRRVRWLEGMSEQRANTVLVESIPEKYRSDGLLKDFLRKVVPGAEIKSVYVAKDLAYLEGLIAQRDAALYRLEEAKAKTAKDPENAPMVSTNLFGESTEDTLFYKEQLDNIKTQIKLERARVEEEAKTAGGINSSSAVVTFADRKSAEVMKRLHCWLSADQELWEVYPAPEPSDILWADLTQDDVAQDVRSLIGFLLVALLYFAYMPCVIGITNVATIVDFRQLGLAPVQPFWQGLAPTLGLQVMMAFLPTFLITIFKTCFTCRSEALQQHKLQIWYFWFQVVFVVLATAVGQNVSNFTTTLIQEPGAIFTVLAETMPYATHFYMNFMVLQWVSHAMVFTRYFPLIKFQAARGLFDEQRSKELAEPEDQDYYGMGARSARWSIILAIALVYGTLCPPMNILGFITFAICRIFYGYLFVFAETKKSDTGGVFWVTQLLHIFVALFIYVILMTGVLTVHAPSWWAGIICFASILWLLGSFYKFLCYSWEHLPIEELIESEGQRKTRRPNRGNYIQPAMMETE